jgi:hypothetical protein
MVSRNSTLAKGNVMRGFAKMLNQLSNEERELALEEIHGGSEVPDEHPAQIERWLEDINDQIRQLDLPEIHAMSKVLRQNFDHVRRQKAHIPAC